jgi:proteasome lid subunit RPN8/RPN11
MADIVKRGARALTIVGGQARIHVTVRHITASAIDAIVAHAADESPNECCGLLVGRDRVVLQAVRARNLRARGWRHVLGSALRTAGLPVEPPGRRRFLLDPRDHIAGLKKARALGLSVLGVYHSHPTSDPVPSRTDLSDATYPDYLYVIVSPARHAGPHIRAYELRDGRFVEVEIVKS